MFPVFKRDTLPLENRWTHQQKLNWNNFRCETNSGWLQPVTFVRKNIFNENISIKVSNLKKSFTQSSPNPQEKDTKGQTKIYCEF